MIYDMRFEVLTAALLNVKSFVLLGGCFKGAWCLHLRRLVVQKACDPEDEGATVL
jgi:hypothetical protein